MIHLIGTSQPLITSVTIINDKGKENENYEIGKIVSSGAANHQNIFAILGHIFEQPVDSLPLTLWKYAQQPYPERVNQAWAAALVLMLFVLLVNISARVWVQVRTNQMQGK